MSWGEGEGGSGRGSGKSYPVKYSHNNCEWRRRRARDHLTVCHTLHPGRMKLLSQLFTSFAPTASPWLSQLHSGRFRCFVTHLWQTLCSDWNRPSTVYKYPITANGVKLRWEGKVWHLVSVRATAAVMLRHRVKKKNRENCHFCFHLAVFL